MDSHWAANVGNTPASFASAVAALMAGIPGSYSLTPATVKHHSGSGDTVALDSANDWVFWRKHGTGADTLTKGTPEESTSI
jgi:hypothetical protein